MNGVSVCKLLEQRPPKDVVKNECSGRDRFSSA